MGDLYEEILMLQPKRLAQLGEEHKVCFLLKVLYGVKQMSRVWYTKIDVFLFIIGLTKSESDHNLYFSMEGDWYVILILYDDDLFLNKDNTNKLEILEKELTKQYEMMNMGLMNLYTEI
jgi:hypothetical protein